MSESAKEFLDRAEAHDKELVEEFASYKPEDFKPSKTKVQTYVERAQQAHVPDGHGKCQGCKDTQWPCDAANLLLVIENQERASRATFANCTNFLNALMEVRQIVDGRLGEDISLEYTPGAYREEAEKVGGRSVWAMRYQDESGQFSHAKRRWDHKTSRIREVLDRARIV